MRFPFFPFVAGLVMLLHVVSADGQFITPATQAQSPAGTKEIMDRAIAAYNSGSDSVAMGLFERAARMGDVDAMMYLGVMHGTGRGAGTDYSEAM